MVCQHKTIIQFSGRGSGNGTLKSGNCAILVDSLNLKTPDHYGDRLV